MSWIMRKQGATSVVHLSTATILKENCGLSNENEGLNKRKQILRRLISIWAQSYATWEY